MNGNVVRASIAAAIVTVLIALGFWYRGGSAAPAPAPAVAQDFGIVRNGTVTDVVLNQLYELDQPVGISLKDTDAGRVYEIRFGGRDRNRRPQYVYPRDLVVSAKVPVGTIKWVPKSSYRELEGIVYDDSTNVKVKALVNPRPGQMVTGRSFKGGSVRH